MSFVIDLFLHLDTHLNHAVFLMGPWIYVLLFLIVFCETGLVVTPFLPGDSLLFALGAMASLEGSVLSLPLLVLLLCLAAILGDATNYAIGYRLGPRIFTREKSWWFNKDYLLATESFYERHGGQTIVIARFMPIIRTFAPFVAGIGRMSYGRFALYNVSGAVLWILTFLLGGYQFGNIPGVKKNFELVIVGIIIVSLLPMLLRWAYSRFGPSHSTKNQA